MIGGETRRQQRQLAPRLAGRKISSVRPAGTSVALPDAQEALRLRERFAHVDAHARVVMEDRQQVEADVLAGVGDDPHDAGDPFAVAKLHR